MSKLLEVKKIVNKINSANASVSRQKSNARSEMYGVGSWWKGEAANAFLYRYNEIDNEIKNIGRRLDDLKYYTNKLVQLLEEEERESKEATNKIRW